MTDEPYRPAYTPGPNAEAFFQYPPAAVLVTVTWAATDGTKPESVVIEWRDTPGSDQLADVIDATIRAGAGAHEMWATATTPDGERDLRDAMGRTQPDPAVDVPLDGPTEVLESPTCPARLDLAPGRVGHTHTCKLSPGHDPVEPDGRQHRCYCGGLFATDAEMPSVPGRATQQRRAERER